MIHVRLKIQLTLLGPILTQSSNAGRLGLDAVMARDHAGQPYLPYSLVRGKLRQALEELSSGTLPEQQEIKNHIPFWFGTRRDADDTANERGAVCFSDFTHPHKREPEASGGTITRIKIDVTSGTAEDKMLMVLDSPFQTDEPATFDGSLWCICEDRQQAEATVKYLLAGLRWVRQYGAERTLGFGRVKGVELTELTLTELSYKKGPGGNEVNKQFAKYLVQRKQPTYTRAENKTEAGSRFVLRIRPRGPFCIAGLRCGDNLYESESTIAGNVLLGALATTWRMASGLTDPEVKPVQGNAWNTFAANFTKLAIGHAFPVKRGTAKRPMAIPLSLVAAEPWDEQIPDTLYDVALCSKPRMVPEKTTKRPPVFQPDWKSHVVTKKAKEVFGWDDGPPTELRVRTAINSDTLRADDEQLFAYQMVIPDQHEWLAYLDLSSINDDNERGKVVTELRQLLGAGLGPLGKTKIDADIDIVPVDQVEPLFASCVEPLEGNLWVVTLQTPAMLCSADDMRHGLQQGYRKTWAELSANTLHLKWFFAQQSLSAPRFAGRLPQDENGNYYPFVLTDAGSTFVLEAKPEDMAAAKDHLQKWLQHGLRADLLPANTNGLQDWQRCPYLPRHGYGEIAVNAPWFDATKRTQEMPTPLEDVK